MKPSSLQALIFTTSLLINSVVSLDTIAQAKREFRAVWVATVDNIDWPSKGNYDTEKQKQEFIKLLEMHRQNGINAVIVQVRPASDALYPSPYEPWSEWLTGRQGKPPYPYYDPLEFMIAETHKRGMEFHAWCNPYRAVFSLNKTKVAATHVTKLHPDWFLNYGDKKYYDPGNKDAQQFVVNVIKDVVSRYEVDAMHFDDYFYPYRITGKEFPDERSYAKYGGPLSREDWRRSNVDSIIYALSRAIKEVRPNCRFGISPFGVWRNKDRDSSGSATLAGQTNYDDLYADILLWLKNNWIDYVAPQLYWEFGHPRAPYEVLLDWWSRNTYGKQCYIGLGIYRSGSNAEWKNPSLLPRQIDALRNTPNIHGMVFFSSKTFEQNPNGWNDSLQRRLFAEPALVPSMSWIGDAAPQKPLVRILTSANDSGQWDIQLSSGEAGKAVKQFIIYEWPGDPATSVCKVRVLAAGDGLVSVTLSGRSAGSPVYAFTSVNFENQESERTWLGL